jgi:uncharacterized protein (TIGR02284 family)
MTKSKTATDILNDLLETLKDGQEGFRTATEDVKSAAAKELFAHCSLQRFKYINELQELAKSLGEPNPTNTSSFVGRVHRAWIDAKSAVTGHSDHAVLAECERGEDTAVAEYKQALENDLPPQVKSVIEAQLAGIQEAHDQVKAMRDSLA